MNYLAGKEETEEPEVYCDECDDITADFLLGDKDLAKQVRKAAKLKGISVEKMAKRMAKEARNECKEVCKERGVPTWVWIVGGVAVVGVGAFLVMRKK